MTNERNTNRLSDVELEESLELLSKIPFEVHSAKGVKLYTKQSGPLTLNAMHDEENSVLLYIRSSKAFPAHKDLIAQQARMPHKRMERSGNDVFLGRVVLHGDSIEDLTFGTAFCEEGDWGLVLSHVDP